MAPLPTVSIVITTRNRCEELRRALRSSIAQEGVECEILVIDDGSTDGTLEAVRREFPQVRLERHEDSCGYIARRNEAALLAGGEFIVSIDDDAEFSHPHVVKQTVEEFDDPHIGAVAIPFINVLQSLDVHQRAPTADERFVTVAFIGTAHALRRELFLALGGYREILVHQGEEKDFCLRMLANGYVVRLGHAEPIFHHESPRRDRQRMDYYGRRNDVLFSWQNVPTLNLPLQMLGTTVKGAIFGFKVRRPWHMLRGLAGGYTACLGGSVIRRPVRQNIYRLYRQLKRQSITPLSQIEKQISRAALPS